jgi:Zn-dependent protease with chaperone function
MADEATVASAEGKYQDGDRPLSRKVVVELRDERLEIKAQDGSLLAIWPLADVRAVGRGRRGELRLQHRKKGQARLILRDDVFVEQLLSSAPHLLKAEPSGRLRFILLLSIVSFAVLALIFIYGVPYFAKNAARLIPVDVERDMGERLALQIANLLGQAPEGADGPFCQSDAGARALEKIVARLSENAQIHLPVTARVVRGDDVNAFALPGGQVLVLSGLLESAENGDQVAGVLAHEIGHVAARHPTRVFLQAAATSVLIGFVLGDYFGAGAIVIGADALISSSYSREAETEADRMAVENLKAIGADIEPLARFMEAIAEEDGGAPLSVISTHPDPLVRAATIRSEVGSPPFESVLTSDEWDALKSICKS